MNPVLQGSALWCALDPTATKIRFNGGCGATAIHFGESRPRFARKGLPPDPSREMLSVLLDSGSVANRLDELCFAGVCPVASLI
jgi:hypothetical protein